MRKSGSRRKHLRRRPAVALGIGIPAVIAAILIFLSLSPGEAFLKALAERRLAAALGQEVRIDYLETNLISRLRLGGVSVYAVQDGDTIPALNLGSARVDYSLTGLIRKRFAVRSVRLDSLFLAVRRDSTGTYNFPIGEVQEQDTTRSEGRGFSVSLGRAELTNVEIQYADEFAYLVKATARGLDADIKGAGPEQYRFEVNADSITVDYADLPITVSRVGVKGGWAGERLSVDAIGLSLPDLALTGNVEILTKGGPGSLSGGCRLKGNPGTLVRRITDQVADSTIAISGELDMMIDLSGSLEQPAARIDIGLTGLDVAAVHVARMHLVAAATRDSVRIDQLLAEVLSGRVSAEATVLMDSLLTFRSSVLVDGLDVVQIAGLASQDVPPYRGRVGGTIRASGRARDSATWEVTCDLGVGQATFRGSEIQGFDIALRLRDGVGDFRLRQGETQITAKAVIRDKAIDGQFSVHIPDLRPLSAPFTGDLAGRIEAEGAIGGSPGSPTVDATIQSGAIRYQDFPVDRIQGRVRYAAGDVYVSKLEFEGNMNPVDTLRPPFNLKGLSGSMGYRGYLQGSVDSISGEVDVWASGLRYGEVGLDRLSLGATFDKGRASIEVHEISRDSLLVRGSGIVSIPTSTGRVDLGLYLAPRQGRAPGDTSYRDPGEQGYERADEIPSGSLGVSFDFASPDRITANVEAKDVELAALNGLFGEPAHVGGTLHLNADISGSFDEPEASVLFLVERPGFEPVRLDSMTGLVTVADRTLEVVALDAYAGPTHHHVNLLLGLDVKEGGGYAISDSSPFRGSASGEQLDLKLLNHFLPDSVEVAGLLSYDIIWEGTLRAPRPDGEIVLRDGALKQQGTDAVVRQVSMDVTIEDSLLTVERLTGLVRDVPFTLHALVNTSQWRDFDFSMDLSVGTYGKVVGAGWVSADSIDFHASVDRLDLAALEPLAPNVDHLSGTMSADVSLKGPVKGPDITGTATIRNLELGLPDYTPPLTGGVVKLTFERTTVGIDTLLVHTRDGYVLASGMLNHERGNLSDAAIAIRMERFQIERPGMIEARVESADLSYTGSGERYLLEGDVVMGKTRFIMDFDPKSILPFARSVRKPEDQLPPPIAYTHVDIRLRESEDLWVDNNVARLRSHAELNFIGPVAQPNVTGRFSIEEGYVKFLDRKFEITSGVVDFVERDRLNPIIEIQAQSRVRAYRALMTIPYTVSLNITGPLEQVRVNLTSDPPLDRANILSLLTLGVTREQLAGTGGEAPTTGEVLRVRAEELTSRVISGYVSRNVSDLIGLKDVSIEGNLFSRNAVEGARLVASKDLSDRVELMYSTNIGHFNENKIRMDYRLTKRFLLQGETDQEGKAGIDLKYRIRAR